MRVYERYSRTLTPKCTDADLAVAALALEECGVGGKVAEGAGAVGRAQPRQREVYQRHLHSRRLYLDVHPPAATMAFSSVLTVWTSCMMKMIGVISIPGVSTSTSTVLQPSWCTYHWTFVHAVLLQTPIVLRPFPPLQQPRNQGTPPTATAVAALNLRQRRAHLRRQEVRWLTGTRRMRRLPQCRSRCSNSTAASATASASTVCTS